MNLGENIRAARKNKGWSQRELAEKIDNDASYIARIESGKINPSVSLVEKIADALECGLDQIIKGSAATIQDKSLVERVRLLESLDANERNAVLTIIDIALKKKRIQEIAGAATAA